MSKLRAGLIAAASPVESGGQRADELVKGITEALEAKGVKIVNASKVVWNTKDAIDVCNEMKAEDVDSVIIIDVTWITDSMKYLFIHEINVPTVFWTVPYTETFSIGCLQHFGSIIKAQGIAYQYVYGLPSEEAVVEKAKNAVVAGHIVKEVSKMRIALAGPRQTWRVAGPQDMTNEEWEFSMKFGPTIIHLEMEEFTDRAALISDEEAEKMLAELTTRVGVVKISHEAMLYNAKIYMAVKQVVEEFGLNAIAAECYPMYGGLMNLPASWIANEGFILDTEGDISHCMVQYIMNLAAGGGAVALGEVGSYDIVKNYLAIAHEGSTGACMTDDVNKVQVSPSGDIEETGAFVGLPVKAMDEVTVSSMQGSNGVYQMLVSKGRTLDISHDVWVEGGEKLLAHLSFEKRADEFVQGMLDAGLDHHLLVKEGDYTEIISMVCDYMDIKKVVL
ncbi:MAG: hypothetical protein ACI4LC_02155 [Emergencia sp.]